MIYESLRFQMPYSPSFDYTLDFKSIDFRQHPELYQMGRGEQGVLSCEPYKSEICAHWRFRTPEIAQESSEKIYAMFLSYLEQEDFVGADMARKFLMMGFTRSRRYANHKSGRKYLKNPQKEETPEAERQARSEVRPLEEDQIKAASAQIFKEKWVMAKSNPVYLRLMKAHIEKYKKPAP